MDGNPTFAYTERIHSLLKAIALLGMGTVVSGFQALTNDRGLTIRRAIRFSTDEATTFYWVMFLLTLFTTVVCAIALAKRRTSTRRLELFDTYLLAPSSRWILSTYEQVIPYKGVVNVETVPAGDDLILRIRHSAGKLDIEKSHMESDRAFAGFAREFVARVEMRQALSRKT